MRIIQLCTSPGNSATRAIYQAGKKRGHQMTIKDPSQMSLMVSNVPSGYDRLYINNKDSVARINIKDYDAVIPRIGHSVEYGSYIIEHLSQNLGIYSTQSAEGILNAANKLRTLQLCSESGIPTPRSMGINSSSKIGSLIDRIGGFPIVVKLVHGSGGSAVALLSDRASAVSTIQTILKSKNSVLIQEYIKSGGKDYRAIVVGNQVVASYQRSSTSRNEFRANLQLGGLGVPVLLSEADIKLCIANAKAIGLSVAGIDFIKDSSGKSYLIEINSNFGFKVQGITGINVAAKIISHIEKYHTTRTVPRLSTKSLLNENNLLKQKWETITKNPELNKIYWQVKGSQVSYIDRNQQKRTRQISSAEDLLMIMTETFQIQTKP